MKFFGMKKTLSILFAVSLITANITASKIAFFDIPFLGGAAIPAGFVAIGAAFIFTDLIGEFYGEEEARKTVNATVIGLVFSWLLIYVSIAFPAAPFYEYSEAFETVLGGGAIIITASIITTLISQNIDVAVFHAVRERTGVGHKWMRNVFSTGISQLVDTTIFIVLGFFLLPLIIQGSGVPLVAIPAMIIGQYIAKMVVAIVDTPIFYIVTYHFDG